MVRQCNIRWNPHCNPELSDQTPEHRTRPELRLFPASCFESGPFRKRNVLFSARQRTRNQKGLPAVIEQTCFRSPHSGECTRKLYTGVHQNSAALKQCNVPTTRTCLWQHGASTSRRHVEVFSGTSRRNVLPVSVQCSCQSRVSIKCRDPGCKVVYVWYIRSIHVIQYLTS